MDESLNCGEWVKERINIELPEESLEGQNHRKEDEGLKVRLHFLLSPLTAYAFFLLASFRNISVIVLNGMLLCAVAGLANLFPTNGWTGQGAQTTGDDCQKSKGGPCALPAWLEVRHRSPKLVLRGRWRGEPATQ